MDAPGSQFVNLKFKFSDFTVPTMPNPYLIQPNIQNDYLSLHD
jgi:hypothetical protein